MATAADGAQSSGIALNALRVADPSDRYWKGDDEMCQTGDAFFEAGGG